MRENRDARIRTIVDAAVRILAAKGYDNATLADIADAAGVSRGLPHYYFKDKETLAIKALETHTAEMISSAVSKLNTGSVEALVDSIANVYRHILQENPTFYTFLFEMWSAGRRSKRIGNMFRQSQDKVVATLMKKLEGSLAKADALSKETIEILSRLIIALTDGIAFQLVIRPEIALQEYPVWPPFRHMLLALLDDSKLERRK
jgi:AcrR family transcriptional regulator